MFGMINFAPYPHDRKCDCCRVPAQWYYQPLPQPWECPRCHKMHGPTSQSCDCKPDTNQREAGDERS